VKLTGFAQYFFLIPSGSRQAAQSVAIFYFILARELIYENLWLEIHLTGILQC